MPKTYAQMKIDEPKRKRNGVYKVCENCQQTFYLPASLADRPGRWCSKDCQKAAHAVTKVCPVCSKSFSVPRSTADRYTVCSTACRLAETKYVNCARCGKLFNSPGKGATRIYCSEVCRRPPVVINCATCGKEFRKLPGDTDRQFCSFACYRRSTVATGLEKITRFALEALGLEFVPEARMGRYSIDFYLTAHKVAVEADGAYWHRDPARDARKNLFMAKHGITVVRLSEAELTTLDPVAVVRQRLAPFIS